ncbi:MAG: 4-hydroxy-tetrahydrodipicolinate synthase [Bryobacterales bacterium]|nr:4-hydroxy-tetrahydrodipicolinate synthase [Bryobacterales bacterium]
MFTGCGTALVTPFRSDLSLDEAGLRKLVERQIGAGIDFLVPCGTTGESPTLSGEEHLRVVEITVETAKAGGRKVPVLAGAGGYNTREVIELAREVEARGADGILSVTPYYNKPTQEGLYQHYKALAAATRLPIVVYSVQGRTGVNVEVGTLERLSALPNIVGVKEASGSVTQIGRVIRQLPGNFLVLSGDDSITLPVMALGGHGIISVASNEAPAMMTNLARLCAAGRFAEARKLHEQHLDLMDVNFVESNPGPVKAAMALMGLLEPHYRLPMVAPKPENMAKIETVLRNLNMIPAAAAA